MRYNGRDKYWAQHEVNMPAGGGSVDRAPDTQRTNASSKLEMRKYSFITELLKTFKWVQTSQILQILAIVFEYFNNIY